MFVRNLDAQDEDENRAELFVMDAGGGNVRRLTSNDALDTAPSWSPDGEQIVFVRAERWGAADVEMGLYVIDSDGSNERRIFQPEGKEPVFLSSPAWSPDGTRIAFTHTTFRGETSISTLYVMAGDGTRARPIAEDAGEPAWSPDGTRLAFSSSRDHLGETCFHDCAPSREIYVAGSDGSNPKRLTTSEATDGSPSWSPDGKRIAFVSDRSNREAHEYEIYAVDADGGTPQRITRNSVWDLEPDWR